MPDVEVTSLATTASGASSVFLCKALWQAFFYPIRYEWLFQEATSTRGVARGDEKVEEARFMGDEADGYASDGGSFRYTRRSSNL